jgi:hypothetical protein
VPIDYLQASPSELFLVMVALFVVAFWFQEKRR